MEVLTLYICYLCLLQYTLRYYNSISGQWDDFTVETGNFGSYVYPGCGAVRNGRWKYLEKPGYLGGAGGKH